MYGVAEIYGLKDPRIHYVEYMYIGYTSGDSRKRLSFHKWAGTDIVKAWMSSLRADGKEPILHVLDRVPATDGPAREQELIDEYDPPLNQRKGGGGIRKKTGGWSEPRTEYYKQRDRRREDAKRLIALDKWIGSLEEDGIKIINGQYYDKDMEWGSYVDEE